jgi:hypothetical protein
MTQASLPDSPRTGAAKPRGSATLEEKTKLTGSAPSREDFVADAPYVRVDPADERETRAIIEMRYQEYLARRALEELFERGELESFPS